MVERNWDVFDAEEQARKRQAAAVRYLEFLRVPEMSAGIYHLTKGSEDLQRRHEADEVYYVLAGKAKMRLERQDRDAHPGTVIYVKRGVHHRFYSVTEDLTVLVVFGREHEEEAGKAKRDEHVEEGGGG